MNHGTEGRTVTIEGSKVETDGDDNEGKTEAGRAQLYPPGLPG